jgi:hypothetical protein
MLLQHTVGLNAEPPFGNLSGSQQPPPEAVVALSPAAAGHPPRPGVPVVHSDHFHRRSVCQRRAAAGLAGRPCHRSDRLAALLPTDDHAVTAVGRGPQPLREWTCTCTPRRGSSVLTAWAKARRHRFLHVPTRHTHSARRRRLRIPKRGPGGPRWSRSSRTSPPSRDQPDQSRPPTTSAPGGPQNSSASRNNVVAAIARSTIPPEKELAAEFLHCLEAVRRFRLEPEAHSEAFNDNPQSDVRTVLVLRPRGPRDLDPVATTLTQIEH